MNEKMLIEAPCVVDIDKGKQLANCIFVHNKQPMSIHLAVEQLAYYFQREFNYDFIQYTAYEDKENPKSNAYIWIDSDFYGTFAIGAIVFRFLTDAHQPKKWSLEWVWFHPYYRNKGLLTAAWKSFQKKYGKDFLIEPPTSKAMDAFLIKMKAQDSTNNDNNT